MNRFFLSPDAINGENVIFPSDAAHQISRVLRLKTGDLVKVLDDQGMEYGVQLVNIGVDSVTGKLIEREAVSTEPDTKVHLLIAVTQREKFELILQKCTEVGVSSFTPIISSRSLVQKPAEMETKYPRWRKIIQEAAEQSHRGILPTLNPIVNFRHIIDEGIPSIRLGIFLWEEEVEQNLKDLIRGYIGHDVWLVVGPEGGFTSEEADLAKAAGFTSVSLGKRILRLETAAIVASSLVLYELG
jgi:16S rRNA (uracil1498-N3)-methyltransferase